MKTASALEGPADLHGPLVLAAGTFDGVHRGHQRIVATAVERAAQGGGQAWVLTFDPHPLHVLRPDAAPPVLTPMNERLALLEGAGPDGAFVLPFTPEFARQEPEAFVERLVGALPSLQAIVVGANWRFGHKARGDVRLLRELSERHGFEAVIVEPVCHGGQPISSTRVRRAIAEARFEAVRDMLGRPYAVTGRIVHGRKVGRRLGYPTANIIPHTEVLPPHGIFAAWALLGEEALPAAAYYGHRPTFPAEAESFSLEVFILEFEGDLYGRQISVAFEEMIRPDCDFPSEAELKAQISRDLEAIRSVLRERRAPAGVRTAGR